MMRSFIGSYYISKNVSDSGKKHTAYQIVDYVGRDHILVEEEGWAITEKKLAPQEKGVVVHLGATSTHKTSIIEISKFIKDHQDDVISLYFNENETKKELSYLSNDLYRCLKNEDYDEWIESLTKEICEK